MTLTEGQWKAVVAHLHLVMSAYPSRLEEIRQLIVEVDRANGRRTFVACVRWRDANSPHPRNIDNPAEWPPTLAACLTGPEAITKDAIEAYVAARTPQPAGIWATRDPAGKVGWRRLEEWS